ncbi:hypothetical protein [Streptomyces sp. TLI_105]|uniref:hypothetical protein n=1 Tax=Streptomyces sp. TLI_105 TaxID=1881019 RepID=UPI0008961CB7|nr:hypothetical protein [Streptomyces sp. TLI_105]SED32661.1 hypothetical protein SAMN05428939_4887 [Streptomyces sp. TLI_105]
MSHETRARATASPAVPSASEVAGRRLRKLSLIWAGLFVPATVLAGIVALTTENAARCLEYGDGCGSTPGYVYLGSLAVAAVAFVIAQSTARTSVARTAFRVQFGAEAVFVMLVMTTFG